MKYNSTVTLKDGRACILRNGTASDGQALLEVFNRTHEQTDYLLSYPDEHDYTAEREAVFLQEKTESADEIELLAEVDGCVVGSAGMRRASRALKWPDTPSWNWKSWRRTGLPSLFTKVWDSKSTAETPEAFAPGRAAGRNWC